MDAGTPDALLEASSYIQAFKDERIKNLLPRVA